MHDLGGLCEWQQRKRHPKERPPAHKSEGAAASRKGAPAPTEVGISTTRIVASTQHHGCDPQRAPKCDRLAGASASGIWRGPRAGGTAPKPWWVSGRPHGSVTLRSAHGALVVDVCCSSFSYASVLSCVLAALHSLLLSSILSAASKASCFRCGSRRKHLSHQHF